MGMLETGRVAIWGAGEIGKKAVEEYGERVECVVDNDEEKIGGLFCNRSVVSFHTFLNLGINHLIIATNYVDDVYKQIKKECEKIDFIVDVYRPIYQGYGLKGEYISNNYPNTVTESNETEWSEKVSNGLDRHYVNGYSMVLADKEDIPMFDHVEIETINRCNGSCSFCPVSIKNEKRPFAKMSEDLFCKIIDELASINYSGKLCLFSNNEPFLDNRIIEFHRIAREKLPEARLHLFTNGSLLTVSKLEAIIPYLDELIIDNYNQELKLNLETEEIYNYCLEHHELIDKVTISLRKQEEILTSRGGNAPNRNKVLDVSEDGCLMPYFQLIIRPDGKVSLCCNDAWGENTLGDVSDQTIMEVWYGDIHRRFLNSLSHGRKNVKQCKNCDTFNVATRMQRVEK